MVNKKVKVEEQFGVAAPQTPRPLMNRRRRFGFVRGQPGLLPAGLRGLAGALASN
jgi:hypothetical protein